jgi:hypothetical protein
LLSFEKSAHTSRKSSAQAYAKASVGGSASVVIETNPRPASSFAKATINVQDARACAKIKSTLVMDQHQVKLVLLKKHPRR